MILYLYYEKAYEAFELAYPLNLRKKIAAKKLVLQIVHIFYKIPRLINKRS